MSTRRLVVTATATAVAGVLLDALTPAFPGMARSLASAQRTADLQGPDAVVTAAAGLLAWAVWAWGALGLALTAASAVPGLVGSVARVAVRGVLPAGARRSAALLLGVGLGIAAPLSAVGVPFPAAAASPTAVPDWPVAPSTGTDPAPLPDWPQAASADDHVVVRGDCLWHIAEDRLRGRQGREPANAEIAATVSAWWTANAAVIGPDPDLLLPGQVLRPPSAG